MKELGKPGLQRGPNGPPGGSLGTSGGRISVECDNVAFAASLSWFDFSSDDVLP